MAHEVTDPTGANADRGNGMEIAIIGMAGRFPGAGSVDELWENLCRGVESLAPLGAEELARVPAALRRSPHFVPVAGTVADCDLFDAAFFGVNPREAELIDPQHRLFLECCWHAFEHAGHDPERCRGVVGVYAGCRLNAYLWHIYSNPDLAQAAGGLAPQVANEKDYLATRISYKLDLGGPSVTVQSACSTSLVAVHLACQGLLGGECDMALAGGVALRIPEVGYVAASGEVNSPDGHVRAFDARAGGTVFASGMGVVMLKRLADALADGDTIHAVIRGSAVTNDGAQKVGFTAPGIDGQVRAVRAALTVAEVEPEEIGYVEAHGTGTPVGDPIEVAALSRVFRERTSARGFCALGSVKTNVGHLGAAAGVTGLIKTVMVLKRREIPPSLWFETPNPQIDFAASPFFVNTRLRPWPAAGAPRRAGVSAFGMGGTNAHVIVEEAPAAAPSGPSRPWQLLLLSARSDTALAAATANLAGHLEAHPEVDLADVAYTLQVGRAVHEHRRLVLCRDVGEARQALAAGGEALATAFTAADDRQVAFLFSGQGAQYAGMGRGIYAAEAGFRATVDECCELLRPRLGFDLREVLFADHEDAEDAAAAERLAQTAVTQPALFVVEYALARLWMAWGIVPRAMLGHSIGEYVAACLAEVMTLADALALVAERGRLMQALPAGAMLAVPLSEEALAPLLGVEVALAAVNAPGRCVVSGPPAAVAALGATLAALGVAARPLRTSHAFHSAMMEPALAPFAARCAAVELQPPRIPYLSNVSGTWVTAAEATDPGYWARHMRQAVRYADGVRELCRDPRLVLLEVGPGQTLATLARQHPERRGQAVLSSLRHPRERQEDEAFLLRTLGQLWLAGVAPDWGGFYAGERRRRIPLPPYPFERRRFWIEPGKGNALFGEAPEAQKREDLADWFHLPYWKPALPPAAPPGTAAETGRWLVFLDESGLGERVVASLAAAGASVAAVGAGAAFRRLEAGRYEVAPGSREDHEALLSALAAAGGLPDRILHLWNVGPMPGAPDAERAVERSFWSLLHLAQAFGRQSATRPAVVAVVSSHVQHVGGEERLLPERALLLGPVKVIPREVPHLRCTSVDVELPAGEATIEHLLAEAAAERPEPVVAYRGGRRWVQEYEPVRLEAAAGSSTRLREGGVYLITGGFGGLGLSFAEFLARDHRARLVLLASSALPERVSWEDWLREHGADDRASRRIQEVRRLEALGAEVLALGGDVADREQMRAAVAAALERFGTIHGVIHAAGVAGGGVIQLKAAATAARVLAPKVAGTRSLMAALAGVPLDFVVLCSSTIAVAGGLGQVDYCAANNFLDAFAHDAFLSGGPRTVSVNWGAWEQVGMAVAAGLMPARGARRHEAERPAGEDIHPLLDRCVMSTAERSVYATDFSAARHWVLDEHRILGTPTLPGTTYLELARAAFLHHQTAFSGPPLDGCELRDVFFLSPLLVPAGEREVRVVLEKAGDVFTFEVASRAETAPGEGEPRWQPHAVGKVAMAGAPAGGERRDVAALYARCAERELEMGALREDGGEPAAARTKVVFWGPRWQSLRRIHLGPGEALALLELPPEFNAEAARYGLHPALLDVATAVASLAESESYLPLSYRGVRVRRPLPRRFLSHLTQRGAGGGETIAVDVVLLTEDGEVLVEIDHFTMKRVGQAAAAFAPAAGAPAVEADGDAGRGAPRLDTVPPRPPAAAGGEEGGGILPAEGVEALRRILWTRLDVPQIVATARDLRALIAQVSALDRARIAEAAGAAAPPAGTVHARPNIPTPFVAPAGELARRLAEIWQAALGIEQVGVDDNFFDLGGDSIIGIQLVARAGAAGLELAPDQLFQHQTIAELVQALGGEREASAEAPAAAAGPPLGVTGYQRELLAAGAGAPSWFATWPLPAATGGLAAAELVARALAAVVARHDALRTRFTRGPEGWSQTAAAGPPVPLHEVELPGGAAREREAATRAVVAELRGRLAPESGVNLAAAVLTGADGERAEALLVAHGAVADTTAWRLLREEVGAACRQVAAGGTVELPPVTAPFSQWLAARRARAEAEAQAPDAGAAPALPGPADPPPAAGPSSSGATMRLTGEDAAALLEEIPATHRLRVEELLLAAVAETLGGGRSAVSIAVEVDGREAEPLGLDLTRTVGCFTVVAPVELGPPPDAAPGEGPRALKEALRRALARGLDAARRSDVAGDRTAASPHAVRLAYLADAEATREESADPDGVSVRARLEPGGLVLDWRGGLPGRPAGSLALELLARLRRLIAACRSSTLAAVTPSDFPDAGLSQDDLDRLFSRGAA